MVEKPGEPGSPGGTSLPDDDIRQRALRARRELADELREAFDRFDRDEREFRRELADRAEQSARDRLDDALREIRGEAGQLSANLSVELDTARAVLRQEADGEVAHVTAAADETLERCAEAQAGIDRLVSKAVERLGPRARRHELKLARQETSRRIERALAALEESSESAVTRLDAHATGVTERLSGELGRRGAEAIGRLEEGATEIEGGLAARREELGRDLVRDASAIREELLGEKREAEALLVTAIGRSERIEERAEAMEARLAEGTEVVERTLREIQAVERRIAGVEERVVTVREHVARHALAAQRAADFERRMRAATVIEEEVARRIRDAEDRIRGMVDPGAIPNGA